MRSDEVRTLKEMLERSAANFSENKVVSFVGEEALSYQKFNELVTQVRNSLIEKGIKKDDKVALLSQNMPNWGVTYFAIVTMGAVVVPILPDFHKDEIENVLAHSESQLLFVSQDQWSKIENSDIKINQVVSIHDFSIINQKDEQFLSENTTPLKTDEVLPDDLASIIYTSGTTGKSKGVMLTHFNLVSSAYASKKVQDIQPTDRFLSILPLSHTYENTLGLILPILAGAHIHYLRKAPAASVLMPALKEVKPTIMLSVPLIVEKIYKMKIVPTFNKKPITRALYKTTPGRKLLNRVAGKKLYETFGGNLVFFGIGGAKLDRDTEIFLREGKFPYAIGYGLTETSPLLAGGKFVTGLKLQATGPAVDQVTLKIHNPDPKTGEGEVWAKGPNVMKGYYKEPELTAEVLTEDGWFKTGDLGHIDKSGSLSLRGRIKNMIVGPSGENIYPEEIEAEINKQGFVLESVVVQAKGKLVALVHLNKDELEEKYAHLKTQAHEFETKVKELLKDIKNQVNARVNRFSQIQIIKNQPEPFIKTATKKIKRFIYAKQNN